ncbi:flagellar hook-basal body complex protein FliE [Succinimonas amylolytica]|uniref:flagellar hook-basal body complex protein FliE n=1 Tax=Succinimonas amylolytica TaxID=83769 RepID=UPI0023A8BEDB
MSNTIDAGSILMNMNRMSLEAGNGLNGLNQISAGTSGVRENSAAEDFGNALKQALDNVNDLQIRADSARNRFDMGDRSMTLADVMIASQKASIALEATVQIRNKMTEAYRTVMQMQF